MLLQYLFQENFEEGLLSINPIQYFMNNLPFLNQEGQLIDNIKLNNKINYNSPYDLKHSSYYRKDLDNFMMDYDKYNTFKDEELIREVKENNEDIIMEYNDYSKIRNNNYLDDFVYFNNRINNNSNNIDDPVERINRLRNSKINHSLKNKKIAEVYDNITDNHFRNQ